MAPEHRVGFPQTSFMTSEHQPRPQAFVQPTILGQGAHPKVVSVMLGHSQIGITLDLYSHVTPTHAAGRGSRPRQVARSALAVFVPEPHRTTRQPAVEPSAEPARSQGINATSRLIEFD